MSAPLDHDGETKAQVPAPSERRGVRRGVYILPTLFTLGNVFCGFLAMEVSTHGAFDKACMLLFLAAILDGLDGRVARLTGSTSAFGEQLDSLSDVISFGMAPAFIVYRWALSDFDRLGLTVSFLFLVCGACRLARFNVQIHVVDKRFFVGLPIPSAAGALIGLIWVLPDPLPTERAKAVFLLVTLVLSYLMISTIKYRSFKDVDLKSKRTALLVPLIAAILGLLLFLQEVALTALLVIYALSGPVTKLLGPLLARRAARTAP